MAQSKTEMRCAAGVTYTLTRRRVRNINLRVHADGSVAASAAPRVAGAVVDAFVAGKAAWLAAAKTRLAARAAADAAAPLPTKAEALAQLTALCRAYYPQFAAICPGGQPPKIAVRDMRTRWGSCSLRTGTLAFSLRLCAMPQAAQAYVVVHEYCHFAHPDHSPAFWALVGRHMPDYAARRALLRC